MRLLQRFCGTQPQVHPEPIFVLGHAKSGTTVVTELLGSISGERVSDDVFHAANLERSAIEKLFRRELPIEHFIDRHPRLFSTRLIKSPKLTFFHAELRARFPRARFVYVVRDPRAVIRSFLGWRGIAGDLSLLADEEQQRQVDVLPRQPAGHYVTRLATRWNDAADVFLQGQDDFVLLRYEDFVRDRAGAISLVAESLGLTRSRDISRQTARSYKASGAGHVPWLEFFGAHNLRLIELACAARMTRLGYE